MDPRKEEALRLILEEKSADEIAKLVKAKEETVRDWFADGQFVARAKKELANACVLMIPGILKRLAGLINEGPDTVAVQAIKVVVKLWETVRTDNEDKRVIDSCIAIIDKVLKEMDKEEGKLYALNKPANIGAGLDRTEATDGQQTDRDASQVDDAGA